MYNQFTLQAQVHFSAQKPIAAQRRGALAQIPETKGEFMIRRLSTSLLRIVALLSVVNTVCQAQSQSSLTRHVRQVTRNGQARPLGRDRKSTRLNSSHVATSYAVFCLKK